MFLNNSFNVLPWYDSLDKQNSKNWYAYGQSWPLLCPQGFILPFQFVCEKLEITSSIQAINIKTGEVEDLGITPTISLGTQPDATYYVVKLPSQTIPVLPIGTYYLKFNTSLGPLYSEEITFVDDTNKCVKIQYWNDNTLYFTSGEIDFSDEFKFELYIRSTIGKPEYEFEEELTKRLGYKFIESQTSNKIYKFSFVAPEYICDAMRLIRLCDFIKITTLFDSYNALSFAYEPKWEDQGDLAAVEVEFDTDCIIQKLESFNRRLKESFYNALLADVDEPVLFSTDTVAQYYTEFTSSVSLINGKLIRQLDPILPNAIAPNLTSLVIPVDNSTTNEPAKKLFLSDLLNLITFDTANFVTITGIENIIGEKNFTGGLKVNGSPIIYNSEKGYWLLQGNLLITGGLTMYADDGSVDLPNLYDGLPIDNQTIYWENGVLKALYSPGGGEADSVAWNNIKDIPSWITNTKPTYDYSEIQGTPDLSKYALVSQIPSLDGYATESWVTNKGYATQSWVLGKGYATLSDVDVRIDALINGAPSAFDTLKEIADVLQGNVNSIGDIITALGSKAEKATTLSGYGITDAYTKTAVNDLLKGYVTIVGTEDVTGLHDFVKGLKVGGIKLYKSQDDVIYIDGNLAVRGGVTMYADDGSVNVGTIYDGLPIDGKTIYWENGILKAVGGGGVADSVAWADITGKPSFATVATSGSYNDLLNKPTLLSSFTNDLGFVTESALSGKYLPLSGGELYNGVDNNPLTIRGYAEDSYIGFEKGNGTTLGAIGINVNLGVVYWDDTNKVNRRLLHEGNYTSYTYSKSTIDSKLSGYLPLTGGTLRGELYFSREYSLAYARYSSTDYSNILYARPTGLLLFGSPKWSKLVLESSNDCVYRQTNGTEYKIWDAGNLTKLSQLTNDSGFITSSASISGNAASATKLATARTIWGQSFDGSGNVDGTLTIKSGGIIKAKDGNGNARNILELSSTNTLYLGFDSAGAGGTTYLLGNNIAFRYGTSKTEGMRLNSDGNVGIGTTSPSYKLHVNGSLNATTIYQNGSSLDSLLGAKLNSSSYTAADVLAKLKTVDGSGSGLDADLLDGVHLMNWKGYQGIPRSCGNSTFTTVNQYFGNGNIVVFDPLPTDANDNDLGLNTVIVSYGENAHRNHQLAYSIYQNHNPKYRRNVDGTWSKWKTFAFTSDNVASATKLQTPRTIWGQSFDGTGNVSGDISLGSGVIRSNNGQGMLSSNGYVLIGYETSANGNRTYIDGNDIYLRYGTTHANGLVMNSSGNVGIGTTNPTAKLHITSSSAGEVASNSDILINGTVSYSTWHRVFTYNNSNLTDGATPNIYLGALESKYNGGYIGFKYVGKDSSSNYVTIGLYAADYLVSILGNGNVGIGTTSPSYKLHVAGTAYISSNLLTGGGITMYSARVLKNVIDERGLSLRELSVIKPTRYTWKDNRDDRLHIGGIADDIQQVLPEVVYRTPDGVLTMDYGNAAFAIASSLIKPIISHEERIARLERENRELKEEIKRLRA